MISSPILLSGPPKCRIWLSVLPEDYRSEGGACKGWLDSDPTEANYGTAIQAGIEVYKSVGPRILFGTLGGCFHPSDKRDGLDIVVQCSLDSAPLLQGTLANSLDVVRSGIPDWAADAILEASNLALASNKALKGIIVFSYGAFGESSSSTVVFAFLTRVLLDILARLVQSSLREHVDLANVISAHRL